ncbi:MAG: hypothetical protein ACJ76J_09290 [Thermoanaerobaculia bacterium]
MVATDTSAHHQTHQAYQILRLGFTIAPIIAGLDKFFHLLTDWNQYLAPFIPQMLGISASTFMMIVGVIEIVAGLLVWFKPRFGGYLVMAWLWAIIINLLLIPGYFDVALRDFGLSLGALSLARLAEVEVPAHAVGRMRQAHA